MAAAITTIVIKPEDGWVALTSADVANFIRINHFPSETPIFLQVGTAPPATGATTSYKSVCHEFWASGPLGTAVRVYARIAPNANDSVRVHVFAN